MATTAESERVGSEQADDMKTVEIGRMRERGTVKECMDSPGEDLENDRDCRGGRNERNKRAHRSFGQQRLRKRTKIKPEDQLSNDSIGSPDEVGGEPEAQCEKCGRGSIQHWYHSKAEVTYDETICRSCYSRERRELEKYPHLRYPSKRRGTRFVNDVARKCGLCLSETSFMAWYHSKFSGKRICRNCYLVELRWEKESEGASEGDGERVLNSLISAPRNSRGSPKSNRASKQIMSALMAAVAAESIDRRELRDVQDIGGLVSGVEVDLDAEEAKCIELIRTSRHGTNGPDVKPQAKSKDSVSRERKTGHTCAFCDATQTTQWYRSHVPETIGEVLCRRCYQLELVKRRSVPGIACYFCKRATPGGQWRQSLVGETLGKMLCDSCYKSELKKRKKWSGSPVNAELLEAVTTEESSLRHDDTRK